VATRRRKVSMVDNNRTRTDEKRLRKTLGRSLVMEDKPEITLYIGDDNLDVHAIISQILSNIPEKLLQVEKLPTDETTKRTLLTEMRMMRTELSKYAVHDKWNAKNLLKTPIITIKDDTYPWWYIEQAHEEIRTRLMTIRDEYLEKIEQTNPDEKPNEIFDETKGILTTEETDMWIKATSKKVKKLIKTPNKLYAEINNWTEDKRAGFMVGWNATNHDTIPDKLRKIAYELESQ